MEKSFSFVFVVFGLQMTLNLPDFCSKEQGFPFSFGSTPRNVVIIPLSSWGRSGNSNKNSKIPLIWLTVKVRVRMSSSFYSGFKTDQNILKKKSVPSPGYCRESGKPCPVPPSFGTQLRYSSEKGRVYFGVTGLKTSGKTQRTGVWVFRTFVNLRLLIEWYP